MNLGIGADSPPGAMERPASLGASEATEPVHRSTRCAGPEHELSRGNG